MCCESASQLLQILNGKSSQPLDLHVGVAERHSLQNAGYHEAQPKRQARVSLTAALSDVEVVPVQDRIHLRPLVRLLGVPVLRDSCSSCRKVPHNCMAAKQTAIFDHDGAGDWFAIAFNGFVELGVGSQGPTDGSELKGHLRGRQLNIQF